jgi:hypothetical protein
LVLEMARPLGTENTVRIGSRRFMVSNNPGFQIQKSVASHMDARNNRHD